MPFNKQFEVAYFWELPCRPTRDKYQMLAMLQLLTSRL